ncbi:MAG: MFS transporter [Thermoflavifilum sp.]|nr:MFS transporter [Thermoflavifilum sp.]MCL6514381.1 MFS transporter [Alicyclobacillus sp.]
MRPWMWLAVSVMVIFGAFDMLRGLAAPLLMRAWHVDYATLGAAFAAGSTGYLGGTFLSGWLVERLGVRGVAVLGSAIQILGTAGVVVSNSYPLALLSFLCSGLGGGTLEIAVNAVVPATVSGSAAQARRFNLLHGAYGAGAFVFPLFAGLVIALPGAWRVLYAVLGLATLVTAFWAVRLRPLPLRRAAASADAPAAEPGERPAMEAAASGRGRADRPWWAHPLLWVLLIAILAYVMAEMGLATWSTLYLVRTHGIALRTGSFLISGFYFWFTLGRLTASRWVTHFGSSRVLAAAVALSLVAVAGLFLPQVPAALAALCLAGLGFAAIFPTITALASHLFPAQAGRVLGLLFTAAGVGSLGTNLVIGAAAEHWGIGASMVVVWLCLVLVAAALAVASGRTAARGRVRSAASVESSSR